jgi:integrase
MSHKIHQLRVREALPPRREPYWGAPIGRGQVIGYRKIDAARGSWIARKRNETGRKVYRALGDVSTEFNYEKARGAALAWLRDRDAGVERDDVTVADACREYVVDRRRERGEECAHDAQKRFERTVYDDPFGAIPLAKLRTPRVKEWRDRLKLSKGSANRTMTALRAALNLAVINRTVSETVAREWREVKQYANATNRRALFLDLKQRRRLLQAAGEGALRDLMEAAALTGARAGELTSLTRGAFDARLGTVNFKGKTGARTVPLAPAALALFKRLAKGKLPGAPLLARADGKPWAHSDWDELVRAAAEQAKLPPGVCLYTLRHSFITQAITDGLSTLDVARLTGTSVTMIEKHYGHLVADAARERLAQVELL